MRPEIKLIYIGILKFGFKTAGKISIIGLIDYIARNKLIFDEEPVAHLNRFYVAKSDDWFWELQMWIGRKSLIIYFDECGCHYQKFCDLYNKTYEEGIIEQYEEFMEQYRWLAN